MERIAIISDIHANITALNAVLDDIKKKNINKIYCLGDSIVKCAHPDLVLDKVREVCDVILLGNCDYSMSRPEAKEKNYWSRKVIGDERAKFLSTLPVSYEFYMSGHLIRLFHASPYSLDEIFNPMFLNKSEYRKSMEIQNPNRLFENTDFIGKTDNDPVPDIVGFGHIHTPVLVRHKNKTIFNPGSVGIPIEMLNDDENDKTNKFSTVASYTIIEGDLGSSELGPISFNFVRVPYNIQKEIEDLENSDMPSRKEIIKSLISAIPNSF